MGHTPFISASVANMLPNLSWLVSVAPAVHHADFNRLQTVSAPWLVIQGDTDEVVPPAEVYAWGEQHPCVNQLINIVGASHFFHGKLVELRQCLENWLRQL